jgi:hypothetical protein
MRNWIAQAAPTLRSATAAGVLAVGVNIQGGMAALATCDQVTARLREANYWLTEHPCPDGRFDEGLHLHFATLSDLIARQEMNPEGAVDLAILEKVIEVGGDFLAWLNEQTDKVEMQ